MSEKLEFLPVRMETSYVPITQSNIGVQVGAFGAAQLMSQLNYAWVSAPTVVLFM